MHLLEKRNKTKAKNKGFGIDRGHCSDNITEKQKSQYSKYVLLYQETINS